MGCCEMVGDYYEDSSVEENLNLLLHLAWVEASVDSNDKGRRVLEGLLQRSKDAGGFCSDFLTTIGCTGSLKDLDKERALKSSVLRLAQVETNVDSKITKRQGILEGHLQGTRMLGASSAALSNDRLHKRFQRLRQGAHTRE